MKKIFRCCWTAAVLIVLISNRPAGAQTDRLSNIVFSYIEGSNEWLSGRAYPADISGYQHRSSLKRVLLPEFEDEREETLISLLVDDVSDRGFPAASLGVTFLPVLSHNYGTIPPGSIFENYPVVFNLGCLNYQSCEPAALKETLAKYLTGALVRNRPEYRWTTPEQFARDLSPMELVLSYEDIYIFTFTKESCPESCIQEFDVFITKSGEILGSRVVKEFIVETY